MAPIVVESVLRYTIVGTLLGEACMNIVDVRLDGPNQEDRTTEAFLIAGDIINNWDDHVVGLLASDYVFNEVRWVDLDSANGTTGSRAVTSETTLPSAGRFPGQAIAGHTYAKMTKNVSGGGRNTRRGVLRLSGLTEDQVSGNNIVSATLTALTSAFESFRDGINGAESGGTRNLVVVHSPEGAPATSSLISSYSPAPTVGTIRRRMPGYGI